MNEIDRILKDLEKDLDGLCDLSLIKAAMVKAAFVAVNDPAVAISVVSYVERKMKNV